MVRVNPGMKSASPKVLSSPIKIHGYRNPIVKGSGMFYVRPNLSSALPQPQRIQYAKDISARFSAMVRQNPASVGTERRTQINLYKQVLANGNYRILEKKGKIVGIIMFMAYQRGQEAKDGVVRLEKAVIDRDEVGLDELKDFITEFCNECRDDFGAKLVISQEKRPRTLLTQALVDLGFVKVDVSKEPVQYRIYRNAGTYTIYKKEL